MAKRKISGDRQNKMQVKFGLNNGIIKVGKGSKIIKSNLQPHPLTATEPPRATCAQFLDGDSAPLWAASSLPDHSYHEKIFPNIQDNSTSLLPNKLCHPCPGLERKGSTAGTVDWGWEKLRAKTPRISALSLYRWSVGAWGLSQGVPKGPEVPQQLRIGICRWDISRERRHRCPNICRNRGAPGLPAHPQEPHSQSDLKSHS